MFSTSCTLSLIHRWSFILYHKLACDDRTKVTHLHVLYSHHFAWLRLFVLRVLGSSDSLSKTVEELPMVAGFETLFFFSHSPTFRFYMFSFTTPALPMVLAALACFSS